MNLATVAALRAARDGRMSVVLATRLSDGWQMLLPNLDASDEVSDYAIQTLAGGRSRTGAMADGEWFFDAQIPAPRLIVVGAVHIAQALAPMAVGLGFLVTVIDPRRSFATAERFPGVMMLGDWPDEAMDSLAPDTTTAVVTLTHDPKLDDPALDRALRSGAFYVGALGSRKTHAARVERLRALGHDDAALARIRGPAGLALGAVSAAEIALSIAAELVAARRGAALAQRTPER